MYLTKDYIQNIMPLSQNNEKINFPIKNREKIGIESFK